MYTPFPQTPWPFLSFVVRTVGTASSMAGPMRAMVARLDPDQALGDLKTAGRVMSTSRSPRAFHSGTGRRVRDAGAGACGLRSVQRDGVLRRAAAARDRHPHGARRAGIRRPDARRLASVRLGVAGLVVGLIGALAATRVLDSLLFGVTATDPVTFAASAPRCWRCCSPPRICPRGAPRAWIR